MEKKNEQSLTFGGEKGNEKKNLMSLRFFFYMNQMQVTLLV